MIMQIKLSKKFLNRFFLGSIGLETSLKSSVFIFDGINLLYHKCHKIHFKRGGSHIDSSDWIRKKKNNYKS